MGDSADDGDEPPVPGRRRFLALGSALAVAAGCGGQALTGGDRAGAAEPAEPAEPEGGGHAALLRRWRELLVGTGYDAAAEPYAARLAALGDRARRYRSAMTAGGTALWADLPLGAVSANVTASCRRLLVMAQAYAMPGTGLTGDAGLADAAASGLARLGTSAYGAGTTPYGNWWDWQIGTPQRLLDCCVLLGDRLDPAVPAGCVAAVDHFVPDSAVAGYSGTSTGANRVDLCRVLAVRGALGASDAKLALARDALSPVFRYVTSGDGLYADGSFVQHTAVPYTGTYGAVLLDGVARMLWWLDGSPWQVTDPGRQAVFDAVERAFAPFLRDGLVMDGVSGRAVSRGPGSSGSDHLRGHALVAAVLRLAGSASPAEAARWRALAKGWLERDRYSPVAADPALGVPELALCLQASADPAVEAAPEPTGHRIFPAMDRAVHHRPDWALAVSMCSARTAYYECGNGENPRGWHTSAGMTYRWGLAEDGGQYSDDFWPTVDPYRLPGVTVSRLPLADRAGGEWGVARPAALWAGGATDGEYAALGQHVMGLNSTMEARKSWFCLDDRVVCLGAGITSRDGTAVESVVDNRNLGADGTAAFTADREVQDSETAAGADLTGARWAHLEGHGGYLFPFPAHRGTRLRALREARTGAWRDVNSGGSTTPTTRTCLTLWFDHGTDPAGAGYTYVLLPGASARRTEAAARAGGLTVLGNTARQQGIAHGAVTTVNFWTAGTAGPLTATGPCSVLVRESGDGTATVCVSDPTWAEAAVDLRWDRPVAAVTARDATVTVLGTGPSLRLRVAVAGATGATHTASVVLG